MVVVVDVGAKAEATALKLLPFFKTVMARGLGCAVSSADGGTGPTTRDKEEEEEVAVVETEGDDV